MARIDTTVLEENVRLDEQISALTLIICDLRTRKNALLPIYRLPPEILASIFIHCTRSSGSPILKSFGVPKWVNVTFVCRHWRNTALNCPTLWSTLFLSSWHWTDELLIRSKRAPLTIHVDSGYHWHLTYFLKKVASQAYRIKELSLMLTDEDARIAFSSFSLPAPILQNLQVFIDGHRHRLGRPSESLPSNARLFNGDTPALRVLEFTGHCTFPLSSPALYGLTALRLYNIPAPSQPALAEFAVALSHMRNLKHLCLENALPSARGSSIGQFIGSSESLALPQLSHLSISAPFSTVILLLPFLDLPLKTQVRLRCCAETDGEDYLPIYRLLAKQFVPSKHQEFDPTPIIHTCFINSISMGMSFVFTTTELNSCPSAFVPARHFEEDRLHGDLSRRIPFKIDIEKRSMSSADRENLIEGVFHNIPLTSLKSAQFTFYVRVNLSSAFWERSVGHLPQLRYIKLSAGDARGLIRALSPYAHHQPDYNPGPHSTRVFAPALEELNLHNIEFSRNKKTLEVESGRCICNMQDLCNALSGRKAKGYGLQQLVFASCYSVDKSDVEDLRKSVTDVDWDTITIIHRSTSGEEEEPDYDEEEELEGEESDYGEEVEEDELDYEYYDDFY